MPAECVVTLQVSEALGTGAPTLFFHVDVDGQPIATNQSLSAEASKTVRELARAYVGLFERRTAPQLTREGLQRLGAHLFDLWLKDVWDKLQPKFVPGCRRVLVVASDVADVLNLPWELLRPPGGDHIGADAKYSVRRLPWSDRKLAAVNGPLRPRPLRILFMACARAAGFTGPGLRARGGVPADGGRQARRRQGGLRLGRPRDVRGTSRPHQRVPAAHHPPQRPRRGAGRARSLRFRE